MPRKTLLDRCKSTLRSQKARAKKYGAYVAYGAEDLVAIVPPACPWCSRKLTPGTINFDHCIPIARGGKWTVENLSAICGSCNRRKGALNVMEYGQLIRFLAEMTQARGDDFAEKNILARLAAGGAWIHG
jgi:5-methylcytosine-specific restriction endonuclease McrA